MSRECGDIGIFRVGPTPVVLLNTPHYAYQVLVAHNDHFEKSPLLRTYLRPLLGDGLLTVDQAQHRPQRKIIAPAMQHHRVTAYADVMVTAAAQLHAAWADESTIDIHHEMSRLTLWIVGQTLFNADVRDETTSLRSTMDTIARVADDLATSPPPGPPRGIGAFAGRSGRSIRSWIA